MKTKYLKIVIILVIFLIIALSNTSSYANESFIQKIDNDVKKFISRSNATEINTDEVTGEIVGIGQILTFVGTGIFVGVIAYMGIKYMTSGPEAQAKLKTQLIGVFVSGIVIFGAYHIWKLVLNIVKNF